MFWFLVIGGSALILLMAYNQFAWFVWFGLDLSEASQTNLKQQICLEIAQHLSLPPAPRPQHCLTFRYYLEHFLLHISIFPRQTGTFGIRMIGFNDILTNGSVSGQGPRLEEEKGPQWIIPFPGIFLDFYNSWIFLKEKSHNE